VTALTADELLAIAERILGHPAEVRDRGLLDSAAGRPTVIVFGREAYPGPHDKAAALLHSLVRNHPLVDGNKRLGWVGARAQLRLAGTDTPLTEGEAYELVIAVATGLIDDVAKIAAKLRGDDPRRRA
jgi:death-on-curing protein